MAIYGTLAGQDSTTTGYSSIQPTLDLNFAKVKLLDPRITFYRDSLATYTDSLGIIRTVPANTPRFDHNPTTGESLGLLIEESRTNLTTYSEGFDDASWSKFNVGVTTNTSSTTAPDGTTNSELMTRTTSSAAYFLKGHTKAASSITYTASAFVKKSVGNYCALTAQGTYPSRAAVVFDINSGTISRAATAYSSFTNASASITPYPNGWYRISLTATSDTATTYDTYFNFNSNGVEIDVTDSASNSAGFIWGAQLEAGAFATSYIPTVASSVTRSADNASMTGTNFTSWYNPNEFTLYGEGRSISGSSDTDGSPAMVSIDDNTSDNRFILRRLDGGLYSGQTYSGFNFRYVRTGQINLDAFPPAVQSTGILPQWTDRNVHKMAFGTSTISQIAYGDGINANITNQVTLTPWTLPTQMQLGFGNYSAVWNGHIGRIMYYPKLLINTQLQNLTAQ